MSRWIVGLALCAACGSDDASSKLSTPTGCDPVDPSVCALPFPSSNFQVEADTVSGVQNAFGPDHLPVNRHGVPTQPEMWNEKDGFSILTPAVIWFEDLSGNGLVSHTDLDAYLADDVTIALLDAETGEQKPYFAEVDATAEKPEQNPLIIRPVAPLDYATRYVIAIRGLTRTDGSAVTASEGFAALRDDEATTDGDIEGRRDHYESHIFPVTDAAGFQRSELQAAWDYTTVSRESSLDDALTIRDDALSQLGDGGPAYTLDSIEDHDCTSSRIARTVEGTLTVPLYTDIDGPGAILHRDADGTPVQNGTTEAAFMVRVPCSLAEDPAEGGLILQYGHGLLGDYGEARTGYLSAMADDNRWVVLAMNWDGMSEADYGEIVIMLASDVSGFRMIPERSLQGFIQKMYALRALRGDLGQDDALVYDGASVVDPDRFAYYGNSQGAIMGGSYVGLSPDHTRAVLGVGGMPYSLLLQRSSDFDSFFALFKELFLDHRDIAILISGFQTIWDPAESAGYAHMTRDPIPGTPNKTVLMQTALGDAQVSELGSHVAARAWDARTIAPQTKPVWGLEEGIPPFEGSAFVEFDYIDGPMLPLENVPPDATIDTHECPRREPPAQEQIRDFVETGVVNQYCDGVCESERAGLCDF